MAQGTNAAANAEALTRARVAKCCVCGAEVTGEQLRRLSVDVEYQRVATCSEKHKEEARQYPSHCRVNYQTALELTPL